MATRTGAAESLQPRPCCWNQSPCSQSDKRHFQNCHRPPCTTVHLHLLLHAKEISVLLLRPHSVELKGASSHRISVPAHSSKRLHAPGMLYVSGRKKSVED